MRDGVRMVTAVAVVAVTMTIAAEARAATLLPGGFLTDPATLGPGNEITDPEGLAIIDDRLFVVDDAGPGRIFGIDLVTGAVTSRTLEFDAAFRDLFVPLGRGTLDRDNVVNFSFSGTGGDLDFDTGDLVSIDLDNTVGTGAPDTTLGFFGDGGLDGDGNPVGPLLFDDDDSSFFGTSLASGAFVSPNADNTITISVSGFPDFDFDGRDDGDPTVGHGRTGDFEVLGAIVEGGFDALELARDFSDPEGLAAIGSSVFVGGEDDFGGLVLELAADTFELLGAIALPFDAEGLASDGTSLFVATGREIIRVDPETGDIEDSATIPGPGINVQGLAFDGENLIAGDVAGQPSLLVIDPVDLAVTSILIGSALPVPSPDGLAFSEALGLIGSSADLSGTSFGLISTTPVPLPAGAWFMLTALGAFGVMARRPRRRG